MSNRVKPTERYAAVFFMGLAAYICWESLGIGIGSLHRPGPGMLSYGAGAAMGLIALAVLIGSFWKKEKADKQTPNEGDGGEAAKVAIIGVALFFYAIAANWLGFSLATLLVVLFLFRFVDTEPWWRSIVKAALVTLGNYLVFEVWLGLHLPTARLLWYW